MTELPDDVTAEAIDAFTVACAKASSVPGASAGDCYRAGLAAALPALTVAAIAAERERMALRLLGCTVCGQIHQPSASGSFYAADGHPYRARWCNLAVRETSSREIADLIEGTP